MQALKDHIQAPDMQDLEGSICVLKYLYIQHKRQAAVTSSDKIVRNMSERRFD